MQNTERSETGESEHYRSQTFNALLALKAWLGWAELSVSRSSTKKTQSEAGRLRDEQHRNPGTDALSASVHGFGWAESLALSSSTKNTERSTPNYCLQSLPFFIK